MFVRLVRYHIIEDHCAPSYDYSDQKENDGESTARYDLEDATLIGEFLSFLFHVARSKFKLISKT